MRNTYYLFIYLFFVALHVGLCSQTLTKELGRFHNAMTSWDVTTSSRLPRKVSTTPWPQDIAGCLELGLVSEKGQSKWQHSAGPMATHAVPKTIGKRVPGTRQSLMPFLSLAAVSVYKEEASNVKPEKAFWIQTT